MSAEWIGETLVPRPKESPLGSRGRPIQSLDRPLPFEAVRAGNARLAASAHRHAERQWHKRQAEAGLAVLDWVQKNPGAPFLAIPMEVRAWLAPDQWQGLEHLYVKGRLMTDGALFERLDRQMVHDADGFAVVDLDHHRLSLGDADYTRFAAAQKAIAEGGIDPDLAVTTG